MLKVLISPSCASCRKVKKWLEDNHIAFQTVNIFSSELTPADVMEALTKSENGTDDIISTRSKVFQSAGKDFDDMTISELVAFIMANPSVLKRPIIIDDHRLQVGYNEDEISTFIPSARRLSASSCTRDCPNWEICENHNN